MNRRSEPHPFLRALHAESERQLSPEEVARWLEEPITEAEREETLSLVRWFCRRYPTPLERLAYVRRAHSRWERTRGAAWAHAEAADGDSRDGEL